MKKEGIEDLREKMEAKRKELNLKWEDWEEDEREREGGGILIVAALLAAVAAVSGIILYVLISI